MTKLKDRKKNLETILKSIAQAAGKVAHTTNIDRDKAVKHTPRNVRMREEAVAGCTKVIKRKVLKKKQARKARADHLVKCSMMPGRRKMKSKPFSDLYVNGQFTEDREEWLKELQRHCEEVYTDQDETREVQEKIES